MGGREIKWENLEAKKEIILLCSSNVVLIAYFYMIFLWFCFNFKYYCNILLYIFIYTEEI